MQLQVLSSGGWAQGAAAPRWSPGASRGQAARVPLTTEWPGPRDLGLCWSWTAPQDTPLPQPLPSCGGRLTLARAWCPVSTADRGPARPHGQAPAGLHGHGLCPVPSAL